MKSPPATRLIQIGGMYRATASPARTAIADVETSASALAAKTYHRDDPLDARLSVASCVLSPISARKIARNVDPNSFQSIARA